MVAAVSGKVVEASALLLVLVPRRDPRYLTGPIHVIARVCGIHRSVGAVIFRVDHCEVFHLCVDINDKGPSAF